MVARGWTPDRSTRRRFWLALGGPRRESVLIHLGGVGTPAYEFRVVEVELSDEGGVTSEAFLGDDVEDIDCFPVSRD